MAFRMWEVFSKGECGVMARSSQSSLGALLKSRYVSPVSSLCRSVCGGRAQSGPAAPATQ